MTNPESLTMESASGRRFASEMRTYVDPKTGNHITALTVPPSNDHKIYQDHPQWTNDGTWIVFRSNRGSTDVSQQAFAVNEISGEIVRLTDGPGLLAGTLNVSRLSSLLYYLKTDGDGRVALMELDMAPLLKQIDPEGNDSRNPEPSRERLIAHVPENFREAGGFALDADEKTAYLGARELNEYEKHGGKAPPYVPGTPIKPIPSRLFGIRLTDGRTETIAETPFLMGHVQTNPWVSGEIVFCNETGGDAPQRMYTMQVGSTYRPLYVETPDEWVTHEAVVTRDEVMFAIMGHLPRLRRKPTGLAVINLRTDEMKILGQCDVGNGFWHVNGSPDGRWAAGDDFDGNIHLIDRTDGKMTLLTTCHVMKPDHAHPTFSPDSKRILFQSGYLSGGKSLNLMTVSVAGFS